MTEKTTKSDPFLLTDEQLLELVQRRIALPCGEHGINDLGILEGAVGALFLGQNYGLKILRLLHSAKTLRKYEQFLGASFEELIPQHGQYIDRSLAWNLIQGTRHYWDVVSHKVKLDVDKRLTLSTGLEVR